MNRRPTHVGTLVSKPGPTSDNYWWVKLVRVDGTPVKGDPRSLFKKLGLDLHYSVEDLHLLKVPPQEDFIWGKRMSRGDVPRIPVVEGKIQYIIRPNHKDPD